MISGLHLGLIAKTPLEGRVAELIEPIVNSMGYELVRVRMSSDHGGTLQIMAERPDRKMPVEDCEALSHALSALLDVEYPVSGKYVLEISSPGIDRPLTRFRDFSDWSGFEARIELHELLNGRRRYRGILAGVRGENVLIEIEGQGNDRQVAELPFALIAEARLLINDALIRRSLKGASR